MKLLTTPVVLYIDLNQILSSFSKIRRLKPHSKFSRMANELPVVEHIFYYYPATSSVSQLVLTIKKILVSSKLEITLESLSGNFIRTNTRIIHGDS